MSRREATGMTGEPHGLRGELLAAATAYRHIREEHRRTRPGGRIHRRLEARLEELSTHFERLLADSPLEETERAEWRRHLHHGGPEPHLPRAEPPPHAAHRPPRNRARGSAPLWQR